MFQSTASGSAAHTLSNTPLNLDEQLPIRLRDHMQRLKLILPVISVSVIALHHQNAELDHDIATILDQHASEPLDLEIENLEALLASLAAKRPREVAT
jgi:hypothetical protein